MASFAVRFFLLALGIDVYVAQHLNLASQAHVWIFLEIAAQPELLHKREGVGVCRRGNCYPICPAQSVAMAVREFPHTTIDRHVVFQRGVAYMISGWHFDPDIFTYKSYGWHDSILQGFLLSQNIAQRTGSVNLLSG